MRGRKQAAHLGHDLRLGEKEVLIGHQGRFFVRKL
jgi:virulence-associated protein VagC